MLHGFDVIAHVKSLNHECAASLPPRPPYGLPQNGSISRERQPSLQETRRSYEYDGIDHFNDFDLLSDIYGFHKINGSYDFCCLHQIYHFCDDHNANASDSSSANGY